MPKMTNQPADYIVPLNMNGLQGRMLHVPGRKRHNREILVVYGHHALLERWWSFVQNLHSFGTVTMPDLPGFGGMDSFYDIGLKPDIDAYADYLASFIKLRYRRRRLTIIGISFGFVVATRMLQKYPDLAKRVDFVVSEMGFAHHDDFKFSAMRMRMYRLTSWLCSLPVLSTLFRVICLNPMILRAAYSRTYNAKQKFKTVSAGSDAYDRMMDLEVTLWQVNDVRTHMATTFEFLGLDNCKRQLPMKVWHVFAESDHYFDHYLVEQHLKIAFGEVAMAPISLDAHAPSITADKQALAVLIPAPLRAALHTHAN